jgi:hypothetical protein
MLKKLLAWGSVLLIAALLAVPAFADPADLSSEWGSNQWLIDQFGVNGDITSFCQGIKRKDQATWTQEYPNLPALCGWSQPQGSSPKPQTSPSQGSTSGQPQITSVQRQTPSAAPTSSDSSSTQ